MILQRMIGGAVALTVLLVAGCAPTPSSSQAGGGNPGRAVTGPSTWECTLVYNAFTDAYLALEAKKDRDGYENHPAVYGGSLNVIVFFQFAAQTLGRAWPKIQNSDVRELVKTIIGQVPSNDDPLANPEFVANLYALDTMCPDSVLVPDYGPYPVPE